MVKENRQSIPSLVSIRSDSTFSQLSCKFAWLTVGIVCWPTSRHLVPMSQIILAVELTPPCLSYPANDHQNTQSCFSSLTLKAEPTSPNPNLKSARMDLDPKLRMPSPLP